MSIKVYKNIFNYERSGRVKKVVFLRNVISGTLDRLLEKSLNYMKQAINTKFTRKESLNA